MKPLGADLGDDRNNSFGLVTSSAGSVIGSVAVGRDCSARYLSEKALRDRLDKFEGHAS